VFWMGASGEVMALDTDGPAVFETPVHSAMYLTAFAKVKHELQQAYEQRLATGGHPGWDLTPFGYIAKSCRDREFFSTGTIPGESIAEATLVEFVGGRGRPLRPLRL
jgi:hypothetical protein